MNVHKDHPCCELQPEIGTLVLSRLRAPPRHVSERGGRTAAALPARVAPLPALARRHRAIALVLDELSRRQRQTSRRDRPGDAQLPGGATHRLRVHFYRPPLSNG